MPCICINPITFTLQTISGAFSFFQRLYGGAQAFISQLDFNNAFLSDIAAFEGVVIGIVLPLAWDALSRSAEKYGDIVTIRFSKHLPTKLLLPSFVFHIILVIATRLVTPEPNLTCIYSKLWGMVLFLWFIANILIFMQYLALLRTYTFNVKEVTSRLFKDVHETIRKG